jgi:hypothetical protein
MFKNLIVSLWNDESGAVIATEYLMLGSIVAAGSAGGMVAMRDSVVDEYKEFGNTIHDVRQAYTPPLKGVKSGQNNRTAPNGAVLVTNIPDAPSAQTLNAACPTP